MSQVTHKHSESNNHHGPDPERHVNLANDNSVPRGLLVGNGVNSGDITVYSHYIYPAVRFGNVYSVLVFLDTLVTIILWLTGGNSKYLIHNIEQFHMTQSVFDLGVISFIKMPVLLLLIRRMELTAFKSFDFSHNQSFKTQLRNRTLILILLNCIVFIFTVVKGSLVLNSLVNDSAYPGMHSTYYACFIWCIVSNFILLVLSGFSLKLIQRMKDHRKLKHFNRLGHEVDERGQPVQRQAGFLRLLSQAKPEAGLLSVGIVALFISAGVQIVAPLFFGKVVDAATKSMDDLNRTVVILFGLYTLGSIAGLMRAWFFTLAGQHFVARLRAKLFASVINQEIAFFDTNRTGEICNRLSSDTQVLQNAVTVNISMLVRYLIQILGSLILMFILNASLTGVLLAVVPVVSLGAVQYGRFVRKMRKLFQDKLAEAGTQAEESISSIRTVRSFTGEQKSASKYEEIVMESYGIGKKLALAEGGMSGLFSFLAFGAVCAVLWYGGKLVNDHEHDPTTGITAGLLTSFLLYTLQVAMGFAFLSSLYGDFMQALGASARIFLLLDRKPEIFVPALPLTFPSLSGTVEFTAVTFKYPSRPDTAVLKDLSFTVESGQMVALVGPSGGGKSTIVNLIERFYDPNSGTIMLGGHDLKNLDPSWFRQKISMVSQEPTLFACSIRDNIAYGKDTTDEEIVEAAKQANAHDFISSFEQGYETLVGERGLTLSGGQKQRVAIARALIMNPSLLLLDEATSALDAESEHLVQEAIDRAMVGRTVIVIAHRLSTVRNANKVIVVKNGQIAEMGTHSELLALDGVYKKLVLRQLTAGQAVDVDAKDNYLQESLG